MYFELTNACNMRCAHCCMNAVPVESRRARYMTREVIEMGCKLASEFVEEITLGGGEPTLHPDFAFALGMSMLYAEDPGVFVITNGTNKHLTLRMLSMSHSARESGMFACEVSEDSFHDRSIVDSSVYLAAYKAKAIRNNDRGVIGKGRGRNLSDEIRCACNTTHISADGKIFLCGCRRKADFLGQLPQDYEAILKAREAHLTKHSWDNGECNGHKRVYQPYRRSNDSQE